MTFLIASTGSWPALLLKYGQGQTVYCIPIHTDLQRSVEKTWMDINDKVCMSVNVCVCMCGGLCWSIKGLSALSEGAIAHEHRILILLPHSPWADSPSQTQFCFIHFREKSQRLYGTARNYPLSSTVACVHYFTVCACVVCVDRVKGY